MTRGRLRPAPRRPQGSTVVLLTAFCVLFLPMLALVRWRYNAAREYTPVHIRAERPPLVHKDVTRRRPVTSSTQTSPTDPLHGSGEAVSTVDSLAQPNALLQLPETGQEVVTDIQTEAGTDQDAAIGTGMSIDGLLLTPRADAHCESQATLGEAHKSELFKCRIAAAQALAEKACDELEANPPDPSFATAHLNIATYANGVRGLNISSPSMTLYQPRIPIAVEPRSDFVSQGIMSSGVWEPAEVKTVLDALHRVSTGTLSHSEADHVVPQEDRAVLVDVGANIGIFSFVAAVLGYTVYAFEAMPRNVAALHQTLCWNPELRKTLTVFPYGLAEEEQACLIMSDNINVADGHVVCNHEQLAAYNGEMMNRGTAHTVRMDSFLAGSHLDVMKIDVEGYEPHVLAGAGDALKDVQYVMTEVSASDMPKKNNASFEEIGLQYLSDWEARGFAIHICDDRHSCFDEPATPASEAVAGIQRRGIVNALMVPAMQHISD